MRKYLILLLLFYFIAVQKNYSQSENNRWIVGIGANAIDFYPTLAPYTGNENGFLNELFNVEDHWNFGGPQILVTRYLVKNLSVEGLLTYNQISKYGDVKIEKTTYFGLDINFRYSLIDTTRDFTIFVLSGLGYTSFNPTFTFNLPMGSAPTFNLGGGANYWFTDTVGLNAEALYKNGFYNLPSHFYYGLSLVFRLNSGKPIIWRNGK